jgi:hypothetical protein
LAGTAEAAPDTMAPDTIPGPTHPRCLRLHPITPDERRASLRGQASRIVCPCGETIAGHGGALSARLRRFFAAEHITGLGAVAAEPRGWRAEHHLH